MIEVRLFGFLFRLALSKSMMTGYSEVTRTFLCAWLNSPLSSHILSRVKHCSNNCRRIETTRSFRPERPEVHAGSVEPLTSLIDNTSVDSPKSDGATPSALALRCN